MKKFIVFFSAFCLSLSLLLPALAVESNTSPIVPGPNGETASPAPEPIVNGTAVLPSAVPAVYNRSVVMTGELMAISGIQLPVDLTVKLTRITPKADKKITGYPAVGASVTVHVTDKSKITRKYMGRAHLSELAVGDKLEVVGKMDAAGAITAKLVKDNSIHKTFYAQRGEVLSIDAAAQTFNIKNDKKELKVFVTPNTKFAIVHVEKPTFAGLKVGDKVQVRGVIRQKANEMTADSVVIVPGKDELKALKEAAKNKAIVKDLEKKQSNLEKQLLKVKGKALEKKQTELVAIKKKLQDLKTREISSFETKFKECKAAKITSRILGNLAYYYEIVGSKDGMCEVKSKFIANPNKEWVGKEMTCVYDNSKKLDIAIQDLSKCQGPLYILMTGGSTTP